MNVLERQQSESDRARQRLSLVKGDPFVVADWERVLFLQYTVPPEVVRPYAPAPLELELHDGQACLSVVAVTMQRLRPARWCSAGCAFWPIGRQCFLNFRTYVRYRDEPGALFLRGWLSRPFGLRLPSEMFGSPYEFASTNYEHRPEQGSIRGQVQGCRGRGAFTYHAFIESNAGAHAIGFDPARDSRDRYRTCASGSLDEFAMERYTGFFARRSDVYAFRAWHPPWLQMPLEVRIEDDDLIANAFPWFKQASFAGASFAPGFERVELGFPHRLQPPSKPYGQMHRLSAFYEMP